MVYAASGNAPFGSDTMPAVINRVLNRPPELSGLDGTLLEVVAACLDKDPARRPTAEQVIIRLLQRPVPRPASSRRAPRRPSRPSRGPRAHLSGPQPRRRRGPRAPRGLSRAAAHGGPRRSTPGRRPRRKAGRGSSWARPWGARCCSRRRLTTGRPPETGPRVAAPQNQPHAHPHPPAPASTVPAKGTPLRVPGG